MFDVCDWHKTDMPTALRDVCSQGQNGSRWHTAETTFLTPDSSGENRFERAAEIALWRKKAHTVEIRNFPFSSTQISQFAAASEVSGDSAEEETMWRRSRI